MSNKLFISSALILCIFLLNSCSILIMRNENERREKVAQDHIGWTQEELEKYWGTPVATANHSDGSKTCIYEFKRLAQLPTQDEKNLIVADVIFLGTAEIAIVPATIAFIYVEEAKAPKTRGFVTYDLESRVTEERCIPIE
jgi:hypothetical protein